MQAVLVLDKSSYAGGEKAVITTIVSDGVGAVDGAAVRVELTTPTGGRMEAYGRTGADGVTSLTYEVEATQDAVGTYGVDALASKDGFDPGDDFATFEVIS